MLLILRKTSLTVTSTRGLTTAAANICPTIRLNRKPGLNRGVVRGRTQTKRQVPAAPHWTPRETFALFFHFKYNCVNDRAHASSCQPGPPEPRGAPAPSGPSCPTCAQGQRQTAARTGPARGALRNGSKHGRPSRKPSASLAHSIRGQNHVKRFLLFKCDSSLVLTVWAPRQLNLRKGTEPPERRQ